MAGALIYHIWSARELFHSPHIHLEMRLVVIQINSLAIPSGSTQQKSYGGNVKCNVFLHLNFALY